MIDIHIQTGGNPQPLAELIASTQGEEIVDPGLAQIATELRAERVIDELDRPSRHDLETVNYQKLDDDNDWSDV